MDLRGQATEYIAIVATGRVCDTAVFTAAHEFGHLLGGGHYDAPTHLWLLPNSRAWGKKFYSNHINGWIGSVTALGQLGTSWCTGVKMCNRLRKYSDPAFGTSSNRNSETINLTARSVANYVQGAGSGGSGTEPKQCADGMDNDGDGLVDGADPQCSGPTDDDESGPPPPPPQPPGCNPAAYVPTNVTASLRNVCVPGTSKSRYLVQWHHVCSGGFYEVFATTTGVGTYFIGSTPTKSAFVDIQGPPATGVVRVRACNSSFLCSGLSSPGVTLVDLC